MNLNTIKTVVKPVLKAPAFAWRCEWKDKVTGSPDGFTYAIEKSRLLQEISRRNMQCNESEARDVKVVMVDWELSKILLKQIHNVFSTAVDKHQYDLEGVSNDRHRTSSPTSNYSPRTLAQVSLQSLLYGK